MSGGVSTFPAVKAAVVTATAAATDLSGVTVGYGDPGDLLEREHVFFGGTSEDGQEWVSVGQFHAEEEYGIRFGVWVETPGNTQQQATERAHVLFGGIQKTIIALLTAANGNVAGAWNLGAVPKAVYEFSTTDGRACLIDGEIHVQARI